MGPERALLTRLLRESVLTLCREAMTSHRRFVIDGIVCITLDGECDDDGDDMPIVVRIHERLPRSRARRTRLVNGFSKPFGSDSEDMESEVGMVSGTEYFTVRSQKLPVTYTRLKKTDLNLVRPLIQDRKLSNSSVQDDVTPPVGKKPRSDNEDQHLRKSVEVYTNYGEPGNSDDVRRRIPSQGSLAGTVSRSSFNTSAAHSPDSSQSSKHSVTVSPTEDKMNDKVCFPKKELTKRSSNPHRVYYCKKCDLNVPDVLTLERHNMHIHKTFTCHICSLTFTARSNLKRHVRMHSGIKPYRCSKCSAAFARKDDLKTHELRHMYNKCDSYAQVQHAVSCRFCPFVGSGNHVLRKHLLRHAARKQFTCPPCSLTYTDPFTYTSHLKSHSLDPEFSDYFCCFCTERLSTYQLFVKHEKTHELVKSVNTSFNDRQEKNLSGDKAGERIVTRIITGSEDLRGHAANESGLEREPLDQNEMSVTHKHNGQNDEKPASDSGNTSSKLDSISSGSSQYWCTECHVGFQDEHSLHDHIANKHEMSNVRVSDDNQLMNVPQQSAVITSTHYQKRGQTNEEDKYDDSTDEEEGQMVKLKTHDFDKNDTSKEAEKSNEEIFHTENPVMQVVRKESGVKEEMLKSLSEHPDAWIESGQADSNGRDLDATSTLSQSSDSLSSPPHNSSSISSPPRHVHPLASPLQRTLKFTSLEVVPLDLPPTDLTVRNKNSCCPTQFPSNGRTNLALIRSKNLSFSSEQPFANKYIFRNEMDRNSLTAHRNGKRNPFNDEFLHREQYVASNYLYHNGSCASDDYIKQEHLSDPEESSGQNRVNVPMPVDDSDMPTDLSMKKRPRSSSPRLQVTSRLLEGFDQVVTPPVLFRDRAPVDCSVCGFPFSSYSELEAHSARMHRRFLCEYCGKLFTAKPNRDRHVRYHTGERPYQCSLCSQSFFRGDDLKYHRTTKHAHLPTSPCPRMSVP